MKKLLLLSLSAMLCFSGIAQQTPTRSSMTKEDYMRKSKRQAITGVVLLGTGLGLMLVGAATYHSGPGSIVFAGVGLITTVVSIPFFVAGAHNKHKANTMAFNFELEKETCLVKGGFRKMEYPALSFTIPLH